MKKFSRTRIKQIGGLIFLAIWIIASALFHQPETKEKISSPAVGFYTPDFSLKSLQGDRVSINDFIGKPVVLTLWASWCAPCKAEMPTFNQVYQEYGQDNVMVVGVNITQQDNINDVKEFVQDNAISFPILLDEKGEVARQYQLQGLPMTFFINPQGKIEQVFVGGPLSAATLRTFFSEYIQEP